MLKQGNWKEGKSKRERIAKLHEVPLAHGSSCFCAFFALLCYLACYGGVGSGVGGGGWRGLPPFACVEKEREVPAIFVWGGTVHLFRHEHTDSYVAGRALIFNSISKSFPAKSLERFPPNHDMHTMPYY